MAYTAEISRANPSCFVFLIDQSGSMQDVMDPANLQPMERPRVVDGRTYTHTASGQTKAQMLADIINRLLSNLVIRCAKEEGVRDFFHVAVVGYGAEVAPSSGGLLERQQLVPISQIANSPARIEERVKKVPDGAGGLVDQTVRFPIWFDPVANGATPMRQALGVAKTLVEGWLAQRPTCFPPIVINLTDGESTDGDPTPVAEEILKLRSSDGEVLLFNLHLSCQRSAPIEYPSDEAGLPDRFARQLFRMSSPLPECMISVARQEGMDIAAGSRGFVFNADIVAVIRFLDIGTRPSALR